MPISSNTPDKQTKTNLVWNTHAKERKQQRGIEISDVSVEYVTSLPYYTNNGCYHYCDSVNGITYYVRDNTIVTIIKRHPISMARRICEIKGWDFNCICRDHLFNNCTRGNRCKYIHKDL